MKKNNFYYSTLLCITFITWTVIIAMIIMWVDVDKIFISIALKSIASLALILLLTCVIEIFSYSDRYEQELERRRIENNKRLLELNDSFRKVY